MKHTLFRRFLRFFNWPGIASAAIMAGSAILTVATLLWAFDWIPREIKAYRAQQAEAKAFKTFSLLDEETQKTLIAGKVYIAHAPRFNKIAGAGCDGGRKCHREGK